MSRETEDLRRRPLVSREGLGKAGKDLAKGAAITIFAVTFVAELAFLCGVALPVGASGIIALNFLIKAKGVEAFKDALKKVAKKEKTSEFSVQEIDQLDKILAPYFDSLEIDVNLLSADILGEIQDSEDRLQHSSRGNSERIEAKITDLQSSLETLQTVALHSVVTKSQTLRIVTNLDKKIDRHHQDVINRLEKISEKLPEKKTIRTTPNARSFSESRPTGEKVAEFDFFISYSFKDHDYANWVADALMNKGYKVFIASIDVPPGENFVLAMHDGTLIATRAILILSKNFLNSVFTQPEWAAFFKEDPLGTKRKLFPIKIDNCDPKGLLGPIVYSDISKLSQEDALEQILADAQAVITGKREMKYRNPFKK